MYNDLPALSADTLRPTLEQELQIIRAINTAQELSTQALRTLVIESVKDSMIRTNVLRATLRGETLEEPCVSLEQCCLLRQAEIEVNAMEQARLIEMLRSLLVQIAIKDNVVCSANKHLRRSSEA